MVRAVEPAKIIAVKVVEPGLMPNVFAKSNILVGDIVDALSLRSRSHQFTNQRFWIRRRDCFLWHFIMPMRSC